MCWGRNLIRVVNPVMVRTNAVGALVEKQQYLQHTNIDRHKVLLTCGNTTLLIYSYYRNFAKQYLWIPSTSVPAGRLFLKAGELASARRSLKTST